MLVFSAIDLEAFIVSSFVWGGIIWQLTSYEYKNSADNEYCVYVYSGYIIIVTWYYCLLIACFSIIILSELHEVSFKDNLFSCNSINFAFLLLYCFCWEQFA